MELFERQKHLHTLEEALQAVRVGEGRLVLISGEAGVGKTSLVEQFTAQHEKRIPVYWGACDALFTPRPLGPFSDIALQLNTRLLDVIQFSPSWHQAATEFLRELADKKTPVIVVVEDIHWADEATLDMLKFLGRRIQPTRLLLVLTFRDDEPASRRSLAGLTGDLPTRITLRLPLAPLSPETVQQMAHNAQRTAEGLFSATGGNPLFVSEMLESEPGVVPASIRDLVQARVSRLSPRAGELAELVALIPGGAELWLCQQIFPDLAQAMDECLERGVLRLTSGSLTYRHELARRAVEDVLPPGRARHLHTQILQSLLAQPTEPLPLSRLVHHAAHAGEFSLLARFAPAAARQASRLGAHREAAALYHLVLSQVTSLDIQLRAELLEGRSFECYLTGEIHTAFQARQQALTLWKNLGETLKEGDSLRWLSRLAWFSGKRKEAEQFAQTAVAILEKQPPGRELAMAYSNKSQLHMLSEENEIARTWGERAIELATSLEAADILIHALTNVGTAEIQAGEEHGWEKIIQAMALARQQELHDDVGRAYANLVSNLVGYRRYAEAEKWLEEGLAYTEEYELDSYRVYLLGWSASLHFENGRWQQAEAQAYQALRLHSGASVLTIPALTALAHLKVRRGDEDAGDWLEKASRLVDPTGELQRIGPLAAACAEAAWWLRQSEQVEPAAHPGYLLALQRQDPWMLGQFAYWISLARNIGDAADVEGKVDGGGLEIPMNLLAEPYRLMVQGEWQAAALAWRELGCPFEQALALAEGDLAAQLEALQIFEQFHARPAAERLRLKMRQEGLKGIPRGPRPANRANLAGLTTRELEVLAMLAEGLSNAGIAERLSISKKTVDHHVSALLGKLGAANRSQALAIARQLGWHP